MNKLQISKHNLALTGLFHKPRQADALHLPGSLQELGILAQPVPDCQPKKRPESVEAAQAGRTQLQQLATPITKDDIDLGRLSGTLESGHDPGAENLVFNPATGRKRYFRGGRGGFRTRLPRPRSRDGWPLPPPAGRTGTIFASPITTAATMIANTITRAVLAATAAIPTLAAAGPTARITPILAAHQIERDLHQKT